jgi:hypothetical protein
LAIGLLLLALSAAFFHDALRPGRVLAPADLAFTTAYYQSLRPEGWTRAANPLLFDQCFQFVPWRQAVREALRQGRLPLWNPESFCGAPQAATLQAAVFYPIAWLTAPLPFAAGPRIGFVLSVGAAAFMAGMIILRRVRA